MADIKVLIADSQRLFAHALAIALSRCRELDVISDLPVSGIDAIRVANSHKPDVVVLDHWIEGLDSTVVTKTILGQLPQAKILHLSWFHGPDNIRSALDAGAVGFLPKGLTVEWVDEAIHRANAGERPVFEEGLDNLMIRIEGRREFLEEEGRRLNELTPRELEVLRYISAGLSVQKIALRFRIKEATIRRHVHHLLGKLGAATQVEAVAIARDHGLVP